MLRDVEAIQKHTNAHLAIKLELEFTHLHPKHHPTITIERKTKSENQIHTQQLQSDRKKLCLMSGDVWMIFGHDLIMF